MLMRSEDSADVADVDCDDPIVAAACLLDTDACPAACKEAEEDNKDEDVVVKSGDLAVSAKAAEGRKALIGGVSDLDTLTFKTSEEVTISSITLERYGYSTKEQVATVQLEDEDGNIIADAKELNSKGQVKLTIKKDYKNVDGTYRATIVVTTIDGQSSSLVTHADGTICSASEIANEDEDCTDNRFSNGSTLWFKVVAAESTAKNLNLDDYDPYTYDLVNYKGSAVEFSDRNSDTKSYNWEADKLYEVAKFRVKAPSDAAILVKGFTLTDEEKNDIEADKFAKDVEVTINGKDVSGLKWNINKNDELVVSFDEVEVAGKETITIAVSMSFNEEFDNFGETVTYGITQLSNFNATDKKTGTRVSQSSDKPIENVNWTKYTFNGGKIKLSGEKLWTVSAAAKSTNVLVAKWEISITEAVRWTISITQPSENNFIEEIRLVINWEEYDATKSNWKYVFKWVEIEKSWKIEVRVDLDEDAEGTMKFAESLNSSAFSFKYDESGEEVDPEQIAGSISMSAVKAQAARAELSKKSTKDVELISTDSNRKLIFDGTYTAKKWDITLKDFIITSVSEDMEISATKNSKTIYPTFYITIGNEEYDAVWDNTKKQARWDIDDIEVADGKSINVKVEIELDQPTVWKSATFNVELFWEDADNNEAWNADEDTVKVRVVSKGTLSVDASSRNTVLLKSDRTLAEFLVKPNKSGEDSVVLDTLTFYLEDEEGSCNDQLKVVVDGESYSVTPVDGVVTVEPWTTVSSEWVKVSVTLKSEAEWERILTLTHLNVEPADEGEEDNSNVSNTFRKLYLPAIIKVTSQEKDGDITKYDIEVENEDDNAKVSDLIFFVWSTSCTVDSLAEAEEGDDDTESPCTSIDIISDDLSDTSTNHGEAVNWETAQSVRVIRFTIGDDTYTIWRAGYEDFFKVNGGSYLMVYSNK